MDKVWVETHKKEEQDKNNAFFENIFNGINNPELFVERDRRKLIKAFVYHQFSMIAFYLDSIKSEKDEGNISKNIIEWLDSVNLEELNRYNGLYNNKELLMKRWDSLLDSEPKFFSGDIIITDPCYIMKENDDIINSDYPDVRKYLKYDFPMQYDDFKIIDIDYSSIKSFHDVEEVWEKINKIEKEHFVIYYGYSETYEKEFRTYKKAIKDHEIKEHDDWRLCSCGENMEVLGFTNYMIRDTLYGDWSCTTYNSDTKESIGNFCADAGLVSVFLLDEVLKYNPDFDYHIQRKWTTTLIKDFEGTVQFVVNEIVEDDSTEYVVSVIGHGKNKITEEPINFITSQTGL